MRSRNKTASVSEVPTHVGRFATTFQALSVCLCRLIVRLPARTFSSLFFLIVGHLFLVPG